jgi:hypothetical protein
MGSNPVRTALIKTNKYHNMRKLLITFEGWFKGKSIALLRKEEILILGFFTKAKLKLEALAEKQEAHLKTVSDELDELIKEKAAVLEAKAQTSTVITELKKFGV